MSLSKAMAGMKNVHQTAVKSAGGVRFDLFFDRNYVMTKLDKKELTVLRRTGGFGRQRIRRSMRSGGKKGKQSAPGEPPRFHSRGFASLKDGIFFNFDLDLGSVAIGASKLRTRTKSNRASGAQLLEEGGAGTIVSYRFNKDRPATRKERSARWQPRPYLAPQKEVIGKKMLELLAEVPL